MYRSVILLSQNTIDICRILTTDPAFSYTPMNAIPLIKQAILQSLAQEHATQVASIIPLLKNQYEAELTALKKPTGRQGRRSNQKTKRIAELSRKLAALDKGRLPQQETKMLKEARDKKARDAVAARVNTIAQHSGHHAEMAVPRGRGKAIDERVAEYLEENEDEKHEELKEEGYYSIPKSVLRRWATIRAMLKTRPLNQRDTTTFRAPDPTRGNFFTTRYEGDFAIIVIDPATYHGLSQPCPVHGWEFKVTRHGYLTWLRRAHTVDRDEFLGAALYKCSECRRIKYVHIIVATDTIILQCISFTVQI